VNYTCCVVGDAVARYVAERAARGEVGTSTAGDLASRLGGLAACCPRLADLDRRAVQTWQATIGDRKATTRRSYLSTVRTFCRWAVAEGLLEHDPTAELSRIREPRTVPRALPAAQLARLHLVLPDRRAELIVALMCQLGLRCVEVARLEVPDWDPAAATIFVRGKADNERVLPVRPEVAVLLNGYLAGRSSGAVFGISAGQISRLVGGWMRAAGIKARPYDGVSAHALRHTMASDMLERCGNVRLVQQALGHASLATTQRYLRRADLDQLRKAMSA
jgi:integrase